MALLVLSTFAAPAFANIAIECGTGIKPDNAGIVKRKFMISSEDGELSGPAGGTWSLYDSKNQEKRNATLKSDANKNLILTISIDASAHVGVQYTMQNPWGQDNVQAVEKQLGGFAGGTTTATLDCVVFED